MKRGNIIMQNTPIVSALLNYKTLNRRRFHVPAHAGIPLGNHFQALSQQLGFSSALLDVDLTELDGLDVLSIPEGCIAESQALTAERYGVAHTLYAINGTSGGLHACLLASFQPDDAVLIPRNAHRSIIAGLVLAGLNPVWCEPIWYDAWGLWGGVSPETVAQAFKQQPHIKGVIITHPTYEGLATDLELIAQLCKTHNKRLIMDEAHGALFAWHPALPQSACELPEVLCADAIVQSPHKTGGSLTQSAWVHLPKGSAISVGRLQQAFNHLQTTSPSYLLLASLDLTSAWLASADFQQALQRQLLYVQRLERQLQAMPSVRLLRKMHLPILTGGRPALDETRFYLRHATFSGERVAEMLEAERGISYESCNPYGALYLTSFHQANDDFHAFAEGVAWIHQHAMAEETQQKMPFQPVAQVLFTMPEVVLSPRNAFFHAERETVILAKALGRISAETIVRCPPGIPILLPGERIQSAHLPLLAQAQRNSIQVVGG
jgi:arginine decarboxylase